MTDKDKLHKMVNKTFYTGRHKHGHNSRGLLGEIEGLQHTKSFGAKHGARHKAAQKKARGEEPF